MHPGRFRIIFVVLLLLIVVGCSSSSESKLLGTWQHVQLQESVEFRKDKTGIFVVAGSPSVPFRWSTQPDDKIQLVFEGGGAPKILTGKMEKDQFILEGDKIKATYRKLNK